MYYIGVIAQIVNDLEEQTEFTVDPPFLQSLEFTKTLSPHRCYPTRQKLFDKANFCMYVPSTRRLAKKVTKRLLIKLSTCSYTLLCIGKVVVCGTSIIII